MEVLVPYSTDRPKSRLSETLDPDERAAFAAAMFADVLGAVRDAGGSPHVLATDPLEGDNVDVADAADATVTVDDRSLTTAVNDVLTRSVAEDAAIAIVMSDLPLATGGLLARFFSATGDVVIAPGRGGGTNALVVRHPGFRVDYHGASYLDHLRAARRVGASVREFDSNRLASDVDERGDLAELLLHGDGVARDWLVDAGFELDVADGRVGVVRE